MQDILDRKHPIFQDDESSGGSESEDSEEDEVPTHSNSNYNKAEEELLLLESYKRKKYQPVFDESKSVALVGEPLDRKRIRILVGPVLTKGKYLPSGKKLASYIDKQGRMDLLAFFSDHAKQLPTIFTLVQCKAARTTFEVGCERFFNLSGYISAPRHTRLKVRTYKCLTLLSSIVNKVYIDPKWVADEYLRRYKAGEWKKDIYEEALKLLEP